MKRYSIVGTKFTGIPESYVASLASGIDVILLREPENPVDPLAIAVYVDDKKIGYLPKNQNAHLARMIDANGVGSLAFDGKPTSVRSIPAKFVRSRNSGYPMVEVSE